MRTEKYSKIIKKTLQIIASDKFLAILILVLSLFVITGLLASRYYLFQNIVENGMSKVDVIAPKTIKVADPDKIERAKQLEVSKIKPVLKPLQNGIDEYIRKNLGELLNSVKEVREKSENKSAKRSEVKELLEISEDNYFINNSIDYLFNSSEAGFARIATESLNSLNDILAEGLSDTDFIVKRNDILTKHIRSSLPKTQKRAISLILNKILEPNMTEDKLATELEKQKAISQVKPIYSIYKKGDIIVSVGDRITLVQKAALKKMGYNVAQLDFFGLLGIFSLVSLCVFTFAYFLITFDSKYLKPSYLALIALLISVITMFAVLLPPDVPVYILPIPAIAMLLTIFTSSRISMLVTVMSIILLGVALQYQATDIFVFLLGGLIAIFTSNSVNYYRRMDIVRAGFYVGLVQTFVIISIFLLQNGTDSIEFAPLLKNILLGFVNGLGSGIIALGSLPLIESAFKIITPYGLAELADHNQILLRRLQFEAPGTYHHSLMVSNLCEAAAEAIGGNPVLARVGAFYHDIGKLKRPLFFIENQSYFGIENPHEKLNPRLSKMVITAHPKDGLELAKEYGLPPVILQFIIQHHGDGIASYFYIQALEQEGAENVSEEQFRYNNPKPSTKETAILMLADAVESAVRSIKTPTQEMIEDIVENIIKERLYDGQLSESPLTQKDLKVVAGVFKRVLRGMQHHRIKYHQNVLEELNQKTASTSLKQIQQQLEAETLPIFPVEDQTKENKQ
ncbi:MAG: HDIG domain-containing metalloprotein [bacterium]